MTFHGYVVMFTSTSCFVVEIAWLVVYTNASQFMTWSLWPLLPVSLSTSSIDFLEAMGNTLTMNNEKEAWWSWNGWYSATAIAFDCPRSDCIVAALHNCKTGDIALLQLIFQQALEMIWMRSGHLTGHSSMNRHQACQLLPRLFTADALVRACRSLIF